MQFRIPTKEECDAICEANETFIKKEEVVNGRRVVQYNYLLASFSDFMEPIKGRDDLKAFELRGITFVEQEDGTWQHYLMLHKFFNLNQTEGYMEQDVAEKEILSVAVKEDGSMISFVPIGDKVCAKTKFTFQSEQAVEAQKIYESDPEIKKLVDYCLNAGIAPIFEYVAPDNRIVVLYPRKELKFIQARDNATGRYLDIYGKDFEKFNVPKAPKCNKTFQELIDEKSAVTGMEGWVVTYSDQMVKYKTDWYFSMHRIVSPDSFSAKPHLMVECSINEKIDDVLGMLGEEFTEIREKIMHVDRVTAHYVNHCSKMIMDTLEEKDNLTRKEFAIKYKEHPMFGIMMRFFNNETLQREEIDKQVRELVLKNVRREEKGAEFFEMMEKKVKEWGVEWGSAPKNSEHSPEGRKSPIKIPSDNSSQLLKR